MTEIAPDFRELLPLPHVAAQPDPRPLYYLWVYDPDKDELHIDHNEDKHPAWTHTFRTVAPHVHHPDRIRGRAFAIKGGWRIMDDSNGEVDPYIARRVHEELRKKHPPPSLPGLTEEHFASLGVSDISDRGAGTMSPEMDALGVRESRH